MEQAQIGRKFINLCQQGNLLGAKRFLRENPHINISEGNEYAFRYACGGGHLHVAQWLVSIKPTINISILEEHAFLWACENGQLHVAKWLISKKPNLNISALNNYAFRITCCNSSSSSRRLQVAQWLQSLKPYLYVIYYDENGLYKDYYIRTKEEANWERRKYLVFISSECKEDNLLYRLPTDVLKMVIGYV